jgi:oligoendopeptidase F
MERKDVKEKYKWKIEDIFATDEEWEKSFDWAIENIDFANYAGKLGDRASLLNFLKKNDEFMQVVDRLAVYANMKHDEDTRVTKYTSYDSKVGMLYSKYCTAVAFFEPEMAQLDEDYLNSLLKDKDFADYDYQIKTLIKGKPHVISEKEERLVALAGETFDTFRDTFGMIDNADLPLPEMEIEGEKKKLTHGLYGMMLRSPDRERKYTINIMAHTSAY